MRDQFDGAIFEGVLLGATSISKTRGSMFGAYIPVYDRPANVITRADEQDTETPSP